MSTMPSDYLAECFWPGVQETDLRDLDERAGAAAATVSAEGRPVRYLGSLLIREDEVVLCQFAGSPDAVRAVAQLAEIPFERIVGATRSLSPLSRNGGDA
jgi:hypothetical protein